MELILSGYGEKPEKTIRLYSFREDAADILWEASVDNASFVCQGDGYLFTVTEALDYAGIYLYGKLENGYRLLDQKKLAGGALCHITYSSKNKSLFGACYETGTLFSIGVEEGGFGELKFHEILKGDAPAGITRVHCVLLNREETQLIVINIALDRAYFYDIREGWLSLKQILSMPQGIGPRHAILSENESLLYIITEYSNEILVYTNRPEKLLVQRISTLPDEFIGKSNGSALCFSKDRKFLYAANRGAETIALFAVKSDGTLGWIGEYGCGGKHPRHMIVTRDGQNLVVCNQFSDNVSVFSIDRENGALEKRAFITFPAPSGILEV